jgi:hypothetical protein
VPTRAELLDQLVTARVAGEVGTPRSNSVRHFQALADGDPHYELGLELAGRWSYERVLELMAERSGFPPDPAGGDGWDYIDPERTVDALDRMAPRLRRVAADRGRVLLATGHPGGLLGTHLAIARALAAAGAEVVTVPPGIETADGDVRQLAGVAVLHAHGGLRHTHSPGWMRLVLDALAAAGRRPPDLVVADHGWAGCAAQRGIETVSFADCNDPALFVAEAESTVAVTVPLEDNLPFDCYQPMNAYLLAAAGLLPGTEPAPASR